VTEVVLNGSARRAKRGLRLQLRANRANRADRSAADRELNAHALSERVLELPELSAPTTVACYVSSPEEPGTAHLLDSLSRSRHSVLLPVLRGDFDLDWAVYEPGALRDGRLGMQEPTGELLGVAAVVQASVVLCPGLAADEQGSRLGRGGGSYDRVLARLPAPVLRVVLLYDDEVLSAVPMDDHDEPVHVVITPTRTIRVRGREPPAVAG